MELSVVDVELRGVDVALRGIHVEPRGIDVELGGIQVELRRDDVELCGIFVELPRHGVSHRKSIAAGALEKDKSSDEVSFIESEIARIDVMPPFTRDRITCHQEIILEYAS